MVSMLDRIADRFHEYHPSRELSDALRLAQPVEHADGIEVVYPTHFANLRESVQIIEDSGLPVSALNLNVKGEKRWEDGSFTSPDPGRRAQAVGALMTGP
jgi:xylose isomerase